MFAIQNGELPFVSISLRHKVLCGTCFTSVSSLCWKYYNSLTETDLKYWEATLKQYNLWHFLFLNIAVLILELGGYHVMSKHLILPGFAVLEHQQAEKELRQVAEAIMHETYHIGLFCKDWSEWDEMYQYAQDGNQGFIETNIQWKSLNGSGIDFIYIANQAGEILWGGAHDPVLDKDITLEEFAVARFPKDHYLLRANEGSELSGLILTGHGPIMISSRPILTSTQSGPAQGSLIMGRFLNDDAIQRISQQTQITFTIKDVKTAMFTPSENSIVSQLTASEIIIENMNEEHLKGYEMIADLEGNPALLVSTSMRRDIMKHGKATAALASFAILAAFTVICVFIVIWFVMSAAESRRRQEQIEKLVAERTKELRENEERLKTLINAMPDVICLKDGEGRWLEANQADIELFQLTGIDYRGKKDLELAPYTHPVFSEGLLTCEITDNQAWEQKTILRTTENISLPDGSVRCYDVIKAPTFNADGSRKGLIVVGRDITEQKAMRDKLQKAENMRAIGLMAGGVAHDLNNILTGIVGYPDILLRQLPEGSKLRAPILAIQKLGQRAGDVVADLLTVARGVAAQRVITNLNLLIQDYLESLELQKLKAANTHITFVAELEPDLLNISCSPIHINKCVLNLVKNATEAINGKGQVLISTRNQYVDKPVAENQYMERGEYVVLSVADTGTGISPKDLEHIFEPFYTKKVMGKSGTGLGLAIVWNTVQDHGGGVSVNSSDRGTVFELYFPSTREGVNEHIEDIKTEHLQGNGEKILIVDDEPYQRDIAERMLTLLGYKTASVSSGENAVAYLKEHDADVVVLDMIMTPGINGRQTYEKIISLHPGHGQKAIVVSGFSENEEVKKTLLLGAGQFLKKPYTIKQIGAAIKNLLHSTP